MDIIALTMGQLSKAKLLQPPPLCLINKVMSMDTVPEKIHIPMTVLSS